MKTITVIGTGYVGLVGGAGLSDFGNTVICCDIDTEKIEMLNNGEIPIYEPGLEEVLARNIKSGRLSFSTDLDLAIRQSDVIFIAVGTPQGENGEADISQVISVARQIGKNLRSYKLICTKSTVPIGTGQKVIDVIKSINNNIEFDYVSNPEFLREGAAVKDFLWPDRVVIGAENERAFEVMKDVYRPLYINETPIVLTNIATAETIKYASNAFLALKISYINEIANLCEKIEGDIHQVARAMGLDGRISSKFLHPGPGYGGSCFPKDTNALVTMADKQGINISTVKAAISANDLQKQGMVNKLRKLVGGSFASKRIAVLGLSFKPQTDDIRDSAAIIMIEELLKGGADIRAYDPIAMDSMKKSFPDLHYCAGWQPAVQDADAVVIMTEWNEFRGLDLEDLGKRLSKKIILDTRNIYRPVELKRLGFSYENVGRMFVV
ncbi:MAG: UDP-glucose/GDP-mannose dehydrogenase family protein [Candidatus Marinimicrobia bacterium]|nr:UDP-glucose/GDP-mannose dehydrogenase family protein [Candidatus Neomarinimicrobiota bacterium]